MFQYFFFSSRRRHTRSKRDWSSDVCSSDLLWAARLAGGTAGPGALGGWRAGTADHRSDERPSSNASGETEARSEERRVGKEWRFGGAEYHQKKNVKRGRSIAIVIIIESK